jgi:hypothetical protein
VLRATDPAGLATLRAEARRGDRVIAGACPTGPVG